MDIDPLKLGTSLMRDSIKSPSKLSFAEEMESQVKEAVKKAKSNVVDAVNEDKAVKKKKGNKFTEELLDVTKLTRNEKSYSKELQSTYSELERFKEGKQFNEETFSKDSRQQMLDNAYNAVVTPFVEQIHDFRPRKRLTKSQLIERWEKFAPTITDDITKRSVRIDIPLLHDVQSLVLRMNKDGSISATLLGSEEMARLIKENKDKLNNRLKHHHLSLKEFNAYTEGVMFDVETGTKKQKRKHVSNKDVEKTLSII